MIKAQDPCVAEILITYDGATDIYQPLVLFLKIKDTSFLILTWFLAIGYIIFSYTGHK